MHAALDYWTKEKITYYERAEKYTLFNKRLSKILENEINKSKSILELGSGLSFISQYLFENGYNIKAVDNSPNAVKRSNERIKDNIVTLSDAYELKDRADILLLIFFGRIKDKDDLSYFMSLANEKIISVFSRHSGSVYSNKKDRTEEFECLLKDESIRYKRDDLTLDFSQPVKDCYDAENFISLYYGERKEIELEKIEFPDYPYAIKNDKKISIFTMYKE